MSILIHRWANTATWISAMVSWGLMAEPSLAGGIPIDLQLHSDRVKITAHNITGDRVSLEVSSESNIWNVHSGVVLSPDARAKAGDFAGWALPISRDGTLTWVDARPPVGLASFYRVRSPGPGWEEARQRWASMKVKEYRYHFRRSCFCFGPPGEGIVHVKEGKVVDVEELNSPRVPPGPVLGNPLLYPTIEGLFDLLDQFVTHGADVIQFSIDLESGMPTWISVDQLIGAIDDEVTYSASNFQRIQ